jgi:hypothetical protein
MKKIILLEFKRTTDCGESYFQDRDRSRLGGRGRSTGRRTTVKEKEWLETLRIFGIGKEDDKRIIDILGHTPLYEHEKLLLLSSTRMRNFITLSSTIMRNVTLSSTSMRRFSSTTGGRPELVDLWECHGLVTHQDHQNLQYLTDSETTLQDINKWIGGGTKLSLVKTTDTDILKAIVIKLQESNLPDQSESAS